MKKMATPRYYLDEDDEEYHTETDHTYSPTSSTYESDDRNNPTLYPLPTH